MSLNKLESVVSTNAWNILCMDSIQNRLWPHSFIHIVLVLILLEQTEWLPSNMFCSFICQSYRCGFHLVKTKSLNYWTLSSRNLMIFFLRCRLYLVVVVNKDYQAWHEVVVAQKIQLVSASSHTPKSWEWHTHDEEMNAWYDIETIVGEGANDLIYFRRYAPK